MSSPRVVYTSRPNTTLLGELNVLAAVYKFVLFDSQARRGDPYDLTNGSTEEMTKHGPRKTEREKT